MQKISAYILAYNEAEKIADAVSSVLWADEIVVADSGSTDRTAEIAQSLGARVVQIPFDGFGDLRNRAIAECRHDWIFSLDSDERCTREVRDEILVDLSAEPQHDAYLVPRRNYMMGRWIKGSGWYPNFRQPQLFRKGAMRYDADPVHEGYELLTERPLGQLQQRDLAVPVPQPRGSHPQDEPLLLARRAQAGIQARVDGKRAGAWDLGFHQALPPQARLPRRLGGLRHRAWAISKARITATPSAMRKCRDGHRRRASRCGGRRLSRPDLRRTVPPSRKARPGRLRGAGGHLHIPQCRVFPSPRQRGMKGPRRVDSVGASIVVRAPSRCPPQADFDVGCADLAASAHPIPDRRRTVREPLRAIRNGSAR